MIYLDNAATTKVSDVVLDAMLPYLSEQYGNPSSIYKFARTSKIAIENAREQVASSIGADTAEIFFTSGGSEADNWAIKGAALAAARKGKKHIITTTFEHHAILHTVQALKKSGFSVTYIPVDSNGLVSVSDISDAIREDTAFVSVMYANNEIGTIQPICEIGKICRERGVIFHTDAVQAVGNVHVDVKEQNIDLLSLSGHKIHAPKGIGALYVRKGVAIDNLIDGGGQERSKRAGTENVAEIVALGVAAEQASKSVDERISRLTAMRDRFIKEALNIPKSRLNGDSTKRLCTNANISFEAIEGEALLLMLDSHDICASSGSACTSGSLDPSHVLLSIGLVHEMAHGSLRITFGDYNSEQDVDKLLEVLPQIVARLRDMSPLWNG